MASYLVSGYVLERLGCYINRLRTLEGEGFGIHISSSKLINVYDDRYWMTIE
ncbi:uncharacterized protein K441DRAFT_652615, partial [Cenococcum geophilum 1.58]|uniref:uncharacterized protein n=1 Tax=Cenococcum geophilum 1.58 TaxID=794803 RepID=UPI00358E726C